MEDKGKADATIQRNSQTWLREKQDRYQAGKNKWILAKKIGMKNYKKSCTNVQKGYEGRIGGVNYEAKQLNTDARRLERQETTLL